MFLDTHSNTAIDCSPDSGSMFAKMDVSIGIAAKLANTRAKPRKIPGVSDSIQRGYVVTDRALVGGNIIARDMLGHLRYWLEPTKGGKPRSTRFHEGYYWEAASEKFWQQQLGCTRQEARTAIKALEKSGAVVREVRQFGNWETDHYRLVLEVTGVKLTKVQDGSMVAANHTLVASNQATSLKLLPEVTKEENLNINNAHESLCAEEEHFSDTPTTTTKAKTTTTPKAKSKATSSPSLQGFPPPPSSAPPPSPKMEKASDAITAAYLVQKAAWGLAMTGEHGCPVSEGLTASEVSALQRIEYRTTQAGLDAVAFIEWLTPFRWQQYGFTFDDDPNFNALHLAKAERLAYAITLYRHDLAATAAEAAKQALIKAQCTATAWLPPPQEQKKVTASKQWLAAHPSYAALSNKYDMDALLKMLIELQYLPFGRKMLAEEECSNLLEIEVQIGELQFDDTLPMLLTALGGTHFKDFFEIVVNEKGLMTTSTTDRVKFLNKHLATWAKFTTPDTDAASQAASDDVPNGNVADEATQAITEAPIGPASITEDEWLSTVYHRPVPFDEEVAWVKTWQAEANARMAADKAIAAAKAASALPVLKPSKGSPKGKQSLSWKTP